MASASMGCLLACSTPTDSNAHAGRDGSAEDEAGLYEAPRVVSLTLPAFYEQLVDETGFGEQIPLGGVEVCVKRSRPYNGAWKDFVDTDVPCVTVGEGENAAFPEVPGLAELIVTAGKDGYRPAVLAVTTDAWATDTSHGLFWKVSLVRSDAPSPHLPPDVAHVQGTGDLVFTAFQAFSLTEAVSLGGVEVSLEPQSGEGPFYHERGTYLPDATTTVASAPGDQTDVAAASFANLPEQEYTIGTRAEGTYCNADGGELGDAIHGWARPNAVLAPVLEEHTTIALATVCYCDQSAGYTLNRDTGACTREEDAGAR